MKIEIDTFRLEAPGLSPEKLPANFAQQATNARVLSGALEAWKANAAAAQAVVKTGTMESIWLMDPDATQGGPYLLHWPLDVDVALTPTAGDTSELTIYTGDGAPKITSIPLATTNPPGAVGAYPYNWLTLGVPAPSVAPTLVLNVDELDEGEVLLTNPGAESGTTGWTVTEGDLLVSTDAPHGGTQCWQGGDAAATEAYQSIDMEAAGLIVGQTLTLKYWQRSDDSDPTTGGTASMGLRFYDSGANPIGEAFDDQVDTAGAWSQRTTTSVVVPSQTVTVRLVQRYERTGTGPGPIDAFIDDVELLATEATITLNGALDDWETSASGSASVTIDTGTGWPAPSLEFQSKSSNTVSVYRDLNVASSPKYTIEFEWFTNGSYEYVGAVVVLDADSAGAGHQLRFGHDGVSLQQTASWDSTRSSSTEIAGGNFRNVRFKGTITVESSSGSKKDVTVSAVRSDNGAVIATATTTIDSKGDYLGFKGWNGDGDNHSGWLDNVTIQIAPGTSDDEGGLTYTNYVYTFENSLDQMGAPSLASRVVQLGPTTSVTVSTPTTAPAGYGVDTKYIWRLVTGSDGTTVYQLVDSIPLAQADYLDTKTDADLEEDILESDGWDLPATDGHSVVAAANGITFLAAKNQIFPSPVNYPHAYPQLWAKNCDFQVVGLATIAADVYAITQGPVYLVTGSEPSALSMEKRPNSYGCTSKRSIALWPTVGVVYACAYGLAYVNAQSEGLLTKGLVSEREWSTFGPESITGIVYEGLYIGFYDNGATQAGFTIDLAQNGTGLGRLDFHATAVWLHPISGALHMIVDDEHVIFNSAASLLEFQWRSRQWVLDRPASFASARIDLQSGGAGSVTLDLYYDGILSYTKAVSTSQEFPLPAKVAEHEVSMSLTGSRKVKHAAISETMEEL